MPSAQVICTCSYCARCTITVKGSQQPGSLVSISTRWEHEKKDKRPTPHTLAHPVSSKSAPNNPRDPNPRKGARWLFKWLAQLIIGTDILIPGTVIVKMVCIFAVWLHLRAGVSRSVANTILRATALIISMAMQLVEASLRSSGILVNLSNFDIPQDVRTAYSLQFVEPDIIQTACCPTCFSLYS